MIRIPYCVWHIFANQNEILTQVNKASKNENNS